MRVNLESYSRASCRKTFTMRLEIEILVHEQECLSIDIINAMNKPVVNPPKVSQVKLLRQRTLPDIHNIR